MFSSEPYLNNHFSNQLLMSNGMNFTAQVCLLNKPVLLNQSLNQDCHLDILFKKTDFKPGLPIQQSRFTRAYNLSVSDIF